MTKRALWLVVQGAANGIIWSTGAIVVGLLLEFMVHVILGAQ